MWPCRSVRDVGTITDEVVPATPVKLGYLLQQNAEVAPLYLVGYIGGEPVYKTNNTLVTGKLIFSTIEIPIKNIFI